MRISCDPTAIYAQILRVMDKMMRILGLFQQAGRYYELGSFSTFVDDARLNCSVQKDICKSNFINSPFIMSSHSRTTISSLNVAQWLNHDMKIIEYTPLEAKGLAQMHTIRLYPRSIIGLFFLLSMFTARVLYSLV